jgi:biotin carboxyl carrier protein/preprotein translocase subunit YajC
MFKRYKKQLTGLLVLALLFSLNACTNKKTTKKIIEASRPKVQVMTVSLQNKPISIETNGIIKTLKSITIKALTKGTINNILVKSGDELPIHQSLAYLFNSKTETNYSTALNYYHWALNYYHNNPELEQTKNMLEYARTNLDLVAVSKSKQDIKTPSAGIISNIMINVDDEVDVGEELFKMLIVDHSKIISSVNPNIIDYLQIDDEVIINDNLKGILKKINYLKNEIEINFDNTKTKLNFKTIIKLQIPLSKLSQQKNNFIIPLKAIDLESDRAIIKIVEDNKIVDRKIKYLQIINDQIVISNGLEEGEQVVIENAKLLKAGTEVEIADY